LFILFKSLFYYKGSYEIEKKTHAEREECLKEIMEPFKSFDKITINHEEYKIVQKFGADMKFIEECYGLQCANASYGCIYCEADLSKPWKSGDEKLIFPINRTLDNANKIVSKGLNNKKRNKHDIKGYAYKPLLHIDFKMIVVDTLHVFLRISDKLFSSLIQIFNENDNDSSSKDFKNRKNLKNFFDILENEIKIVKPFFFAESEIEKVKLRSFNGSDRERIFKYFSQKKSLENHFPKIKSMMKFSLVFNSFWALFCKIKDFQNPLSKKRKIELNDENNLRNLDDCDKLELEQLDKQLRSWIFSYVSSTLDTTLSPYLHIFAYHTKEIIELHGNINLYNTQGLERLNSTQTSIYFRQTNKAKLGKSTYIKQLVDNKNRNDFHNLNGRLEDLELENI
jgi:hypothetical protein